MKNHFIKARKVALEITKLVATKDFSKVTEEDLDILAESVDLLNDAYEIMYDNVFVEVEEKK